MPKKFLASCLLLFSLFSGMVTADGNRLAYLSEPCDPFYVNRAFPRLITPQWVGQTGVEGVIVLSIDDMRDPQQYEQFLRPILERLKKIDGRAPLSILTNTIHADSPQLQSWLEEGLSLEVHTVDHPCPCLRDGNFDAARSTYDRCVDLMSAIPGNRPVAYRMPCCDSINSTSPRFWAEVFNRTTTDGNYLQIDSSVFHVFTSSDTTLPPEMATRPDGKSRFHHYLPFPSFVNTIEDYPYPYVIGRLCWEVPCLVPSDWEGQNVQQPNHPQTLADMKMALDATRLKQGATSLVFHPHGWITSGQIVEFIDHAVKQHGDRIQFLSFREYQNRLNKHLLVGQPLRDSRGQDNGVRLIDLNHDGFLDVVIGNPQMQRTRLWMPETNTWRELDFPVSIVDADRQGNHHTAGVQFFVTQKNGHASLLVRNERQAGVWHFVDDHWVEDKTMLTGLEIDGQPVFTAKGYLDQGVRLRDLDADGHCELIAGGEPSQVFRWNPANQSWKTLPFGLPADTSIVDPKGQDAGLRFVDVDDDGHDDVLFSDDQRYSLHLFRSLQEGWNRLAQKGTRPDANGIPPIVSSGANNGAWFSRNHMWVQNEATSGMPDLVDRRSFSDLLGDEAIRPRSPEASLSSIEVSPEYRVELVAAEPLVQDPVAFDWGPDGRLWVVEMADYPLGMDDRGKPGGRIRVLQDTDGDGIYDQSELFADEIGFPTDLMVWRNGVLVTAAPNVWYLEDTDDDGKADHKEAWFTGFVEGNQQHRVNGLRWGLDNWVYLANGDSGGRIRSVRTGETVDINGRDLRIRPDTGQLQAVTGQTQHGRCRDDWGNWWGANNSTPMIQFVMDDHYLRRNPFVPPPDPRFIARDGQWGLYPISRILSHYSEYVTPPAGQPGQFTSACGTVVYRDSLLGEKLTDNLFVSEPVHNLVHRRVIQHDGLLRRPRKPAEEEGREFLRSRDSWFRPTSLRTGPDGCLWIADMYRLVIEHPEWIDDDLENTLDLRAGHQLGRIYRVVPRDKPPRPIPDMTHQTTQQLVQFLADPSGTTRDLAHRLLLWREDRNTNALLSSALSDSKNPHQRLAALCVLAGRDAALPKMVMRALQDTHPAVRRHAIRIAEQLVDPNRALYDLGSPQIKPDPPEIAARNLQNLLAALVALSDTEDDPQVVMQLVYSLGAFDHPDAGKTLGQLIVRHQDDPYLVAAAISSITRRTHDVVSGALDAAGGGNVPDLPIESFVRTAIGQDDMASVRIILQRIMPTNVEGLGDWQMETLASIDQSLRVTDESVESVLQDEDSIDGLTPLRIQARRILVDAQGKRSSRAAAFRFLSSGPDFLDDDVESILSLLSPQTPSDLQHNVIESIGRLTKISTLQRVLDGWPSYGPLTRDRLIGQFLQRRSTTGILLDAVRQKKIEEGDINLAFSQAMIHHNEPQIAKLSAQLLDPGINLERQQVIDRYLPTVKLGGDVQRGRVHFAKTCAQCHQLGEQGYPVGPNLAALIDLSAEFLTTHILDSPRAIEDKYRNYIVLTTDGRQYTGLLQNETATSVTLVGQNGETQTVLKRDIEEDGFRRSKVSMMPQGLETSLNPQALADVVSFVVQFRQPPKTFSGNEPRTVEAQGASRVLSLTASAASIFGPSLVFESTYGNLGFWASIDDRAQWRIEVPEVGRYDVYLDWAVPDGTANNSYVFQIGDSQLTGRVASTGSWDHYQQTKIGAVNLPAGGQIAVFRAAAAPSNCLIDLREICLVPAGQQPPEIFKDEK